MKIDDQELRRLYGKSVQEKCLELRKPCPTLKKVFTFFRPGVSRKRKLHIIDHITSCASCSKEFAFLLEIHRKQEILIRYIHKESPASVPHSRFLRYAPVAAGLFLFVFVSLFLYQNFTPSHRHGIDKEPIQLVHPSGRTSLVYPLFFKWNADKEAEYYILEIFDASLRPFWRTTDIDSNFYLLPKDIISRMKPHEPYYWMITAVDSEGNKNESKIRVFIPFR
ncbi:MAG: hypothetical protein SCM96_14200 [Acidobacteriota bacterium]|nr:hypothetical protein [Acidobacteriota bacterium]